MRSAKLRERRAPDANATLAREVEEHGDDAMSVYADWMQDQGAPRGELAQVQLELAKQPKLAARAKALLKKHAGVFLGKLAGLEAVLQLEWRAGFIHKATLGNSYGADTDIVATLEALLAEPSARFLRELTIGIVTYEDNSYDKIARVIAKRYLPSLRALRIGEFASDEMEVDWCTLGAIEPMYAALPNLRELTVRSSGAELGSIVLPNLETFSLVSTDLSRKAATAIAKASWPALRSLSLQLGPVEDEKTAARIDDLLPILDGARLPRLEHLGLRSCQFASKVVERLVGARLLPQLSSLDLNGGTLGDEGAAQIFRLQRAFAHLTSIELADNYISDEGQRRLEATDLAVELGAQRDDDGDPSNRYVSGYE